MPKSAQPGAVSDGSLFKKMWVVKFASLLIIAEHSGWTEFNRVKCSGMMCIHLKCIWNESSQCFWTTVFCTVQGNAGWITCDCKFNRKRIKQGERMKSVESSEQKKCLTGKQRERSRRCVWKKTHFVCSWWGIYSMCICLVVFTEDCRNVYAGTHLYVCVIDPMLWAPADVAVDCWVTVVKDQDALLVTQTHPGVCMYWNYGWHFVRHFDVWWSLFKLAEA